MKILLNETGTFELVVTTAEDTQLFTALESSDISPGEHIGYGGRSGTYTDADFHLLFKIGGERFVLREDKGEDRFLGLIRDACFFAGRPTLLELSNQHPQRIVIGVAVCTACGNWMHGCTSHCSSCQDTCDHVYERRSILSLKLGMVMANACTVCGCLHAGELERLKKVPMIDRLIEVEEQSEMLQYVIFPPREAGGEEVVLSVREVKRVFTEQESRGSEEI